MILYDNIRISGLRGENEPGQFLLFLRRILLLMACYGRGSGFHSQIVELHVCNTSHVGELAVTDAGLSGVKV